VSRLLSSQRRAGPSRGAYLPLFALCLVAFFGLAALAIDVGSAYWKKRDLQNAEDAAALAGAAFLPCLDNVNPPTGTSCVKTAQTVAKQYLRENGYDPATFTFDYGCMPAGVADKATCAPRFDYFKVNDHAVVSPNVFGQLFGVSEFRCRNSNPELTFKNIVF
jgi:Flp pilus assembly protein TadG